MLLYIFQLCVVFFITLSASLSFSAVIFSDNFDSHSSACHTGGDVPSGWTMWYENDIYETRDSVTHYAGEIAAPGRGGTGKSLKIWRHSDWPPMNNYSGGLRYDFNGNYTDIFIRYYIKLPSSLSFNISDYIKSWRFNTTGGSGEIYLDFRQASGGTDMHAEGSWGIYDGGPWVTVLDNNELRAIWDGNWHCIEFQLGLNSRTLNLWVDGILKYSDTNRIWQATGRFDFIQHFAIGNCGNGGMWQNSWQAIEFDDIVISTTYVGPGDGVPPIPDPTPSPSSGSSGGGGGCFISTAAFGSSMAPAVKVLREFREKVILKHELGRAFVAFYQEVSPPIADFIARHNAARILVRMSLLPLVGICWILLMIGPMQTLLLVLLIIVLVMKKQALSNLLRKCP